MQFKFFIKKGIPTQSGFTMIEILMVIAIFGIVSAVVLFNHGKFTSETILTNMAYEMSLSIREAQIYGVSVRAGVGESFDNSYGVYIPVPSSSLNQYILFIDEDGDNRFRGTSCENPGTGECVTPYTFQRNIFITGTDIKLGGSSTCDPSDEEMHIVFRRPNPEPIVRVGNSGAVGSNFSQAQITIRSADNDYRYVVISNNGQIAVQNTSICN